MKAYLKIFIILSLLTGLCACGSSEETETADASAKIVKVQAVSEESVSDGYSYLGIVKAKETKNYSFLSSGKIEEICVEKGQQFKAGDVLARLDTTTMEYNASIGQNTQAQAEAVLQKTISTYDTNISNTISGIETLEKSIAAGEKGIEALELGLAAEQQNIDAAQTSLDTLYSNLNAARELNEVGGYSDLDLDAMESQYKTSSAELEAAKAAHEGNKAALESQKAELEALKARKTEAETTLENLCTSKAKDVAATQADVASASLSTDIINKNISDAHKRCSLNGGQRRLRYGASL